MVCAQPFACLPNHVTGRGMFGKIRRLHPEANIVSIDYDPGASEANQLNRIKLMIAAAKKAHNAKFAEAGEPQGFTLSGGLNAHTRKLPSMRGAVAQRLRGVSRARNRAGACYRFFV